MTGVRILVADDHRLFRAGLHMLISEMEGIDVLAEAGSGPEALTACAAECPDLVLMDVAMPGMSGLETLEQIKESYPAVHVLMLSMLATEEHVMQALRLGASGYLLKDAAPAELELAIRAVMRGETWLSSAISRPVVEGYMARTAGDRPHTEDPLTTRQREVLRLIAEGKSTKEIAFTLGLSIKTIETHRMQIMERLDVHDLAGLVRYAIRSGLVSV